MVLLWNPHNLVLLLESILSSNCFCFCFCLWIHTASGKFSVKIHQCKKEKKTAIKKLWDHDFCQICSGFVLKRANSRTQMLISDEQSVVFTASSWRPQPALKRNRMASRKTKGDNNVVGKRLAWHADAYEELQSFSSALSWCTYRVSQQVFWIQLQKRPDHFDNILSTRRKHEFHRLTQLVVLFSCITLF